MARTHETNYRYELDLDVAIDVRFLAQLGEVVDYAVVLLVEEHTSGMQCVSTTTLIRCTTCTDTIEQARSRRPSSFIEAPRARLYRARSRRFEAATVRWSNHGDGKQKHSYSGQHPCFTAVRRRDRGRDRGTSGSISEWSRVRRRRSPGAWEDPRAQRARRPSGSARVSRRGRVDRRVAQARERFASRVRPAQRPRPTSRLSARSQPVAVA